MYRFGQSLFAATSNLVVSALQGGPDEPEGEASSQPANANATSPRPRFGQYLFNPPLASEEAENPIPESSSSTENRYSPTVEDVLDVKKMFIDELELPLELIDSVIDFAEYWPHTSSFIRPPAGNPLIIRGQGGHEDQLLLRTPPIGYIPHQPWENTVSPSKKTITDVGPELEGTGKFSWALPGFPRLTLPEGLKDDAATEQVLKAWEGISSARGFPCRKVVFTIKSNDQGWGGISADQGTYKGTWTWFDVGLERMIAFRDGVSEDDFDNHSSSNSDFPIVCSTVHVLPADNIETITNPNGVTETELQHELPPQATCLQKNLTATREVTEHVITWSADDHVDPESSEAETLEEQGRGKASLNGEFMRNLKMGDSITVWGKARFGGWSNFVTEVKVDVHWAV